MSGTEQRAYSLAGMRGGLDRDMAARVSVVSGAVALVEVFCIASLALINLYGPMGDSPHAAALVTMGCAVGAAFAMFLVTVVIARRSRAALALFLAVLAIAAWQLLPRQVDVHESWVPEPNERFSCDGWTIRHYPPQTFDADSTIYCVGIEHRLPNG